MNETINRSIDYFAALRNRILQLFCGSFDYTYYCYYEKKKTIKTIFIQVLSESKLKNTHKILIPFEN